MDEIVAAAEHIAPAFGGISLEDILAPRCFEVENWLQNSLDIPVVHDDQHGTTIVILAAIMNALRLVHKQKQDVSAVLVRVDGIAAAKLLLERGIGKLLLVACSHVDPHLVERYCRDFIYEGIMAPVPALNEIPRKEMEA